MSSYMVFDSHCDTPYELWLRGQRFDRTDCQVSLQRAEMLPAYAQFFAFCTLPGKKNRYTYEELFYLPYREFVRQIELFSDRVSLCRNGVEMERSIQEGKIAAFLSLEGAEGIGCDPGRLDELAEMGIRMVNLTWNADNALAGCSYRNGGGLTAQGREFVRKAQRLGILIDVSHISDRAFFDIMDITERPVVASHSNSRSLCGHSRNLTDEQYRLLCATGGYAGINLYTAFLSASGKADFETIYAHMDHFLQLGGEHVALGGDLDGCDSLATGFTGVNDYEKLANFLKMKKYSEEMIQNIFSNTIKKVVTLCTM